MALQKIDRQKAKHAFKTAPRKAPALVNRTNKSILPELAPLHVWLSRFSHSRNYIYSNDWSANLPESY